MRKANDALDTTVSTGILTVMALLTAGGIFANAAPASAPFTPEASVVHVVDDTSEIFSTKVSGGRLQK